MTEFYQVASTDEASTPINIPTAPPPAHQNASTKVVGGTTSITFRADGGATTTTTRGSVSASDLTPYSDDDWRSTAKNSYGNPTSKITADSVVEIDGLNAQVDMFVKAGVLMETPDGFELASKVAPQGTNGDTEEETQVESGVMPAEIVDAVNSALDGMNDSTVQKAGSIGIAAAVGDMTIEDVSAAIALDTGMEPTEAAQRTQFVVDAYQAQADHFITSHLGIPSGDLQNFYEFCRQPENKGALQTAVQQQVFGNSMAAFKPLVESYMSNVAPSARALVSRGFETKTAPNGEELVRIRGQWMPTKVAAKIGLI
ncbi:hypothetical protein [Ralstonia pseudosolanacearum]|uniref:hypothetical protein n=1 Tax=Ralstonia pseudosolanacearum TaxID=1310165 RepID=UPI0008DA99B0|nr:hypothetical protein [Ralstonia pseudosolanacearum]MCL1620171.1 hypothetical protein [Ralstonia pseudosolanacearum CaRs-Mep]